VTSNIEIIKDLKHFHSNMNLT